MKQFNSERLKINIATGVKLLLASLLIIAGKGSMLSLISAAVVIWFPFFALFTQSAKNSLTRLADGDVTTDEEKALLSKIQKSVKQLVEDANKENVTKESLEKTIEKLNKQIETLTNESKKALKDFTEDLQKKNESLEASLKTATEAMTLQGAELKKLKEDGVEGKKEERVKFRDALKDALMEQKDTIMKEVNDDYGKRLSLKSFVKNANRSPEMVMKAPVDMFETLIAGNNVPLLRLTELDPVRVSIPLAIYPHVFDFMQSKGITRPYMSIMIVWSYEDGSGTKVEGAASNKSSFLLKTQEFKAFFIATHFVLSEETLDDLNEVLDEISIVAPDKILDKIDSKILSAAGDDINDIMGIMNVAKSTPYANPAGFKATDATIIDLAVAAKLQISKNRYRANVIVMNPTDIENLGALKNTLDDSRQDRRIVFDAIGVATAIAGLRIIPSESVPVNQMLVLDNKQPWIGRRRDMTVKFGLNGTDLVEGQQTMVINVRIAFGVRDKAGVVFINDVAAAVAGIPA